MLFYWPKLLYPYNSPTIFHFLFFLSIDWYYGAGVFGLIGCISLSLSLALPTSFNNNNNNNNQSHTTEIIAFAMPIMEHYEYIYIYIYHYFAPIVY